MLYILDKPVGIIMKKIDIDRTLYCCSDSDLYSAIYQYVYTP